MKPRIRIPAVAVPIPEHANPYLQCELEKAKHSLGERWLLHSANRITRQRAAYQIPAADPERQL